MKTRFDRTAQRLGDWFADAFDDLRNALRTDRGSIAAGVAIGATAAAVALAVAWPSHRPAPVVAHAPSAAALAATAPIVTPATPRNADFAGSEASEDARRIADWVAGSRDNRGANFAILDKRAAELFVFDADARLVGSSRVLLGAAPGDDSVAGIGQRPMDQVRPEEKTTPAGRFVSHPGRNSGGEEVIWVDYDAAVSMHRVRIVDPKERRLERLAHGEAQDRRISYGCINIPVAFFDAVMRPRLGGAPGVVYVLPERKALEDAFPAFAAAQARLSPFGSPFGPPAAAVERHAAL